jgi:SAM-dependent methyltransferase
MSDKQSQPLSAENNIIFLISLPRSGSTLLQHILASHSMIAATAEPWVLFPAVTALKQGSIHADYNADIGRIALTEFLSHLPEQDEAYYHAVQHMRNHLYQQLLDQVNKTYFLDKTSRYYLFLPEIVRTFPKAKYIFLIRNPLATLASFLDSMVSSNWLRLGEPGIRQDLLEGYHLINQGIRYFGDDAIVIHYEELVRNPQTTIDTLCQQLEIPFEPEMLNYGDKIGVLPGRLVDPKSIHKHNTVVDSYVDNWSEKLTQSQQKVHFAHAFLQHLGAQLIDVMGYSYSEMKATLPAESTTWKPIVKWDWVMLPESQRSRWQKWNLNIAYLWQKEGGDAVAKYVAQRLAFKLLWPFRFSKRIGSRAWRKLSGASSSSSPNNASLSVSADYQQISRADGLEKNLTKGWQSGSVAERQLSAYLPLLEQMYKGYPRRDFMVAAQALRLLGLSSPTLLEIGCGNGYYAEILSYLASSVNFDYTGLDYSGAMCQSAYLRYPHHKFIVGSALQIPLPPNAFDIVWSGTILMHLINYEDAITETIRVSRRFCVFHSTPLLIDAPTSYLRKTAYGTPVPEVIINQNEFEAMLHSHGLKIKYVLPSLPYQVNQAIEGTIEISTYICEK